MKISSNNLRLIRNRFIFLSIILIALIIILLSRSFYLQYIESDFLNAEGDKKHIKTLIIPSSRGTIYDRNSNPLAVSIPVSNLVVDPKIFLSSKRYQELSKSLASVLKIDHSRLDQEIKKRSSRRYFILSRELEKDQVALINRLKKSNYFWLEKAYKRFNPNAEVTTQIIGFNDNKDQGQEGLEYALNNYLSGQDGKKKAITDIGLNTIEDVEIIKPAKQGKDFYTSIDVRIQYIAHAALNEGVNSSQAKKASAVVLDIKTGEVLAIVNNPSADMSNLKLRLPKFYKNRALTDKFEPGSTFKPLIVATALEHEIFNSTDTIDTLPYSIGSREIKDPRYYGPLSLGEILIKSSNVGASKISLLTDPELFYEILSKLGIGQATASGFPGETSGTLDSSYQRWRDGMRASLAFGYNVDVNLIQLANAYATIANRGVKNNISLERIDELAVGNRVLSEQTSQTLLLMLEQVVERSAVRAQINGYRVGGKTGTAQIAAANYSRDAHNAIFVGIVPISDPRIVVAVIVNEPQGREYYGGQVAAPIFASIASRTLRLLGVAPDKI
jgi:cell division protein FtsI (penicillin-binding protein 3)|tara:strand:+ start:1990 stop:3663 length:1674 start_codon:yes stop_codon:yes gene_type:complete